MKIESIKIFLKTLCDYNTVKITHAFASNDEQRNLSVRCMPGTETFIITDMETNQEWQNDSPDETSQFITDYLQLDLLTLNS